jgi:hypothetical protein
VNVNIYHRNLISEDDVNDCSININSTVSLYGVLGDGTEKLLGQKRIDNYDAYVIYGNIDDNYTNLRLTV